MVSKILIVIISIGILESGLLLAGGLLIYSSHVPDDIQGFELTTCTLTNYTILLFEDCGMEHREHGSYNISMWFLIWEGISPLSEQHISVLSTPFSGDRKKYFVENHIDDYDFNVEYPCYINTKFVSAFPHMDHMRSSCEYWSPAFLNTNQIEFLQQYSSLLIKLGISCFGAFIGIIILSSIIGCIVTYRHRHKKIEMV